MGRKKKEHSREKPGRRIGGSGPKAGGERTRLKTGRKIGGIRIGNVPVSELVFAGICSLGPVFVDLAHDESVGQGVHV